MIDKLEVGVKYKLVDEIGYTASNPANRGYVTAYLSECGCFILDYIDRDGDGVICGVVVIGLGIGEGDFFTKYDEKIYTEYRVIRKASGQQVCDWRKGEKLYEDEYGTLVRDKKRTNFYTDIVEWREMEKPVTLEDIANKLDSLNLPFSDKEREELIGMAAKYKQSKGGK